MKIRNGFVSNSSSASFTIIKEGLSPLQLKALLEYEDSDRNEDNWGITINNKSVFGFTVMNNGAIHSFLDELGIPKDILEFDSE